MWPFQNFIPKERHKINTLVKEVRSFSTLILISCFPDTTALLLLSYNSTLSLQSPRYRSKNPALIILWLNSRRLVTLLFSSRSVNPLQIHRDVLVFLGYVTGRREYSGQNSKLLSHANTRTQRSVVEKQRQSTPEQSVSHGNSHRARCDLPLTHSTPRAVSGVWTPGRPSHPESWHLQKGVLTGQGNGWSSEPADCQHWLPGTELHHTPHPGRNGSLLRLLQTQAGPLWKHRAAPSLSHSSHDLKKAQVAKKIESTDARVPWWVLSAFFTALKISPPERKPSSLDFLKFYF